jgi:hypothetical protein
VELLTTGQYRFDDTPVTDPDGTTHPPQGLWSYAGKVDWGQDFNHPEWNTKTDPATGEPVMPWAGTTFKLDPLSPVTNYLAHLQSDPTSEENAVKFPTLEEADAAVQKFAWGFVVDMWPIFPGSPLCQGLCGPLSDLGEPWYHDTRYRTPPADDLRLSPRTTDPLSQNSSPMDVNASPRLQSSGAHKNAAGRHSKVVDDLGIAQATNAAGTEDAAPSTDALDHQTKPAATKDGKKFELRRLGDNPAPRGGLAAAVNAGLDQLRSSLSPKKPSGADNGGSEAGESDAGVD